jgi:hypothetical protein
MASRLGKLEFVQTQKTQMQEATQGEVEQSGNSEPGTQDSRGSI